MNCGTCKKPVHYEKAGGRGVRYHEDGQRECDANTLALLNLTNAEQQRLGEIVEWATMIGDAVIDRAEEVAFLDGHNDWHDYTARGRIERNNGDVEFVIVYFDGGDLSSAEPIFLVYRESFVLPMPPLKIAFVEDLHG
jgi:hypothetical protein